MIEDRHGDETGRIAALRRYEVMDVHDQSLFAPITELVRLTLDVPVSAVVLIDRDRQAVKSPQGFGLEEAPAGIALAAYAIRQAAPLAVGDLRADRRFAGCETVTGRMAIRSAIAAPLTTPDGYNIGTLCAMDRRPRRFVATQRAIIEQLGRLVIDQLELRQIARTDPLTGALTRRGFLTQIERDLARARRYARPSALLLIDVDHFERINAALGQGAGDALLARLAAGWRGSLRQSDVIGRMGGDEFAVLLPETGGAAAMECAERLRRLASEIAVPDPDGEEPVTVSCGVAGLSEGIVTAQQWLAEADIALYEAKVFGRNRSALARPERYRSIGPETESRPEVERLN